VGNSDGINVGMAEGRNEGKRDGIPVGDDDGINVGMTEGEDEGT